MEKTPVQPRPAASATMPPAAPLAIEWWKGLPFLDGALATLCELRQTDAAPLLALLATEDVAQFISPPPCTVEGFERFIAWTIGQRVAGRHFSFAVVPHGMDTAVGLFQVRSLDPGFGVAEWGFVLASPYWGSGMFVEAAKMVVDFAFQMVGAFRLEARAAVRNGRGNGALRKIGAVHEGVLRRSFLRAGEYHDQALWTILAEDWRDAKSVRVRPDVH